MKNAQKPEGEKKREMIYGDQPRLHRSSTQPINQCKRQSNQSSSSVSVSVSLVSSASPSVSLSSLEESEAFRDFLGLGACPVFKACIWPAIESGKENRMSVFGQKEDYAQRVRGAWSTDATGTCLPSSGSLMSSSSSKAAALAGSSICRVISILLSRPR